LKVFGVRARFVLRVVLPELNSFTGEPSLQAVVGVFAALILVFCSPASWRAKDAFGEHVKFNPGILAFLDGRLFRGPKAGFSTKVCHRNCSGDGGRPQATAGRGDVLESRRRGGKNFSVAW
jgi:hypothetical protein